MRDYGKVHTSFWTSANIRALSEDGRALAMYLLTSPHGTIAGVFRLPDGYACEDLQWDTARVSKGFAELFDKGFANRCETTKWVWVIKHFDWNPPENPNQKKSAAKVGSQVPDECAWKQEFMRACGVFMGIESAPKTNPSGTLAKPFPNQEQEQDKEEANASLSASPQQTEPDEPEDGVPPCPFDSLIDSYEAALPVLPTVRRSLFAKGANGKALRARWRWVMTAKHERGERKGERLAITAEDGRAWFSRYFEYVADSDFLSGRNGKFQSCDLGWLVTAANFEKVLSGKYHHEQRESANA